MALPVPAPPAGAPECAWVVLLMLGDGYTPGALVVAESLRRQNTAHDLVCMVTPDVSAAARAHLRRDGPSGRPLYDAVVEVPYLTHRTRPFESKRQAELYGGWIDHSFTKWQCLTLTQYRRVLLVDADMVFTSNCDDLFDLHPPAACYSNPWAHPHAPRSRIPNPYVSSCPRPPRQRDLPHGARIPWARVLEALRVGAFVGWGALVLLAPGGFAEFGAMVCAEPVYGLQHRTPSGSDEVSIAEYYAARRQDWTHIHPRYLAIPWHPAWVPRGVRAHHYHGRKPWDMDPAEWADLALWWEGAQRCILAAPELREVFHPPAGEKVAECLAALQLTNDLRALMLALCARHGRGAARARSDAARARADAALSGWQTRMANTMLPPSGAASACLGCYRAVASSDPCNDALVAHLQPSPGARAVVDQMVALVQRRVGRALRPAPPPTVSEDGGIVCGAWAHPASQRIARLIELGGVEAAAMAALRHESQLGQLQPCVRQAHADYLYAECGVLHEAFASPMDARYLDKEGGSYYSAHPNEDAVFGASGDFFNAFRLRVETHPGGWLVHPPAELAHRAACEIADTLEAIADPPAVYFLAPDGGGALAAARDRLRASRCYVAERRCAAYALETPAGGAVVATMAYAYIALCGPSADLRTVVAALEHAARS
jgi:hypothetical protein